MKSSNGLHRLAGQTREMLHAMRAYNHSYPDGMSVADIARLARIAFVDRRLKSLVGLKLVDRVIDANTEVAHFRAR